jgi:hypothetical protein
MRVEQPSVQQLLGLAFGVRTLGAGAFNGVAFGVVDATSGSTIFFQNCFLEMSNS